MNVLPFSLLMKEWILQQLIIGQFDVHQLMVIMNVFPFSSLMKEWILQPMIIMQSEWHQGRHECVALLLADRRVDPSADSNEAIRLASNIGHHGCVSLFWADPRVRERRVTHAFH